MNIMTITIVISQPMKVDDLNMEDPYSFSHRTWELEYQRKQELQKNHPVQSKAKSHNTEL